MKTIDFQDISKENMSTMNHNIIKIKKNNKEFKIFMSFNTNMDKIIISFTNNVKKDVADIKENIYYSKFSNLIIEDLTATENNLEHGFGIGNSDKHYANDYVEIINKVNSVFNIKPNNVYFTGEYENGFLAILMSVFLQNSTAIVHNPINFVQQIDVQQKNKLYKTLFSENENKKVLNTYLKRFSTTLHMRKSNIAPKIFYIQNDQDSTYKTQFNNFLNKLEKYNIYDGNVIKLIYSKKENVGKSLSFVEFNRIKSLIFESKNFQYMFDNVYYNSTASVVLLDDDSREESYNILYKYAKEKEIKITFGVNSAHILNGTKNRINEKQFIEMSKDNSVVEFVNHTHSHVKLTELSKNEIHNEIKLCKDFLTKHNINTSHLIYPFGKVNDEVISIASQYVNSGSKTNGDIVNPKSNNFNKLLLNRIAFEAPIDKIERNMLKAIKCNGCLIINIHAQYDTFSIKHLEDILELTKKYKLDVIHLSEAIDRLGN